MKLNSVKLFDSFKPNELKVMHTTAFLGIFIYFSFDTSFLTTRFG
jgi:hypothetical protein